MNKYPASSPGESTELHDKTSTEELKFPIDPEFLSVPPRVDLQLMLQRIEESMPWRNSRPGEAERRLALKVDVEFVL